MVSARSWTGSRQHPHAAEGSQSTNRNEPAPGSMRAGGAARNGPLEAGAFTLALRASVVDGMSTAPLAAQPSPGDRSVERHGGLLHGLAGALLRFCAACRAVVRRFTTQPSPGDRFCRPPRRSASWPCQALRSGFAQQIAQALDVLPGHRGRHDVARRLGRWRSRRRWCWRCRAGLLGPRIELAAHGALDDAEQVPGGVADAMLAAPCGPLVQHSLPQGSVHLLQRHPGAGLLFRLQFRETLGPLQVAQRARLRGSTYFINTTTTY